MDASERRDVAADRLLQMQHRLHHWAVAAVQANRGGLDLSLRQVAVLYMIRNGAGSPSRIARRLRVTPAVVTGLLDRLEQRGHVQRLADPSDRRRFRVVLTDAGEAAADAVMRMLSREVAEHLSGASAAELDGLERALGMLERMMDALEKGSPTPGPTAADRDDPWNADRAADGENRELALAVG